MADGVLNRNLTEQFRANFGGEVLSTTRTKQRIISAVLASERAHVFDHTGDAQETATRHVGGANRNFLR